MENKLSFYKKHKFRGMRVHEVRALKYLRKIHPDKIVKFNRSSSPDFIVYDGDSIMCSYEAKTMKKDKLGYYTNRLSFHRGQMETIKSFENCKILVYGLNDVYPRSINPKFVIPVEELEAWYANIWSKGKLLVETVKT